MSEYGNQLNALLAQAQAGHSVQSPSPCMIIEAEFKPENQPETIAKAIALVVADLSDSRHALKVSRNHLQAMQTAQERHRSAEARVVELEKELHRLITGLPNDPVSPRR